MASARAELRNPAGSAPAAAAPAASVGESAAAVPGDRFSRTSIARAGFLVAPSLLPWCFVGPQGTWDPPVFWALTAAAFFLTGVAARGSRVGDGPLHVLFYGSSWLVTLHLMVLAHANAMHPFYAVGSIMALVTTALHCRSRESFVSYVSFGLLVACVSLVLEPGLLKAAYWIGLLPAMIPAYVRLSAHLDNMARIESYQTGLEAEVQRRTAELERVNQKLLVEMEEREALSEQLRFSQKMEAVGRLAGGIAHDFNNFLTVIRTYSEILIEALPPGVLRSDAQEIARAGERASQLTVQLVTFARGGVSNPEILDLNEILTDLHRLLRSLAGEDVALQIATASDLLRIRADRHQLEQILLNLVLNARDAMPNGGTLSLETSVVRPGEEGTPEADGPWVRLAVTDDGIGMTEETRSRAFEPFFTTKGVGEGSGLGLSIVYGIVEQARGQILIESAVGKGTSFHLLFPAYAQRADERPARAVRQPPRVDARGHSALVVDDDPSIRSAVCRTLRSLGFSVFEAPDGDEALGILEEKCEAIDFIITDVVMPRVSGIELVARAREIRPDVQILLTSGHTNHPSLREDELPLDIDILPKPFTPADLIGRVREMLRSRVRMGDA